MKDEFLKSIRKNSEQLFAVNGIDKLNEQIENNFDLSLDKPNNYPVLEENPYDNEIPYAVEVFDLSGIKQSDNHEL